MKENYPNKGRIFPFLKKTFFALLVLLFFGGFQSMKAQKMEKVPGIPIICPANPHDTNSRMGMYQRAAKKTAFAAKATATAELVVTYGPGALANEEARNAFQFALDIWAEEIVSSVPIKIYADFADLGPGVLASAGPTYQVRDFPGAPEANVLYPAALANALAGEVLFPDEDYDLVVNLGNGIPWYFGTDGNTPAGLYDFVTIALHEAGHGLGFTTTRGYSAGVGSLRSGGSYAIFSKFYVDGDGNRLTDFDDPSADLGAAFTGGDLYVDGTFATAALGGNLPKIYAPSTFQGGSSLAHWDEAEYPAGDPNSLMTPAAGSAESNFDIGDITRGHFKDMGWVLNDADAPPIVVTPQSIFLELQVEETTTSTLSISNISDNTVVVTPTTASDAVTISSFSPTELIIDSGDTGDLEITFSTVGLTKGIYEETITLSILGSETIITVPVTVRVLDGTEAPSIVVTPTSFEETIEQYMVASKALSIQNSGDADLSYTIMVNDNIQSTFANRVAAAQLNIVSGGFEKSTFKSAKNTIKEAALITTTNQEYNKIVSSLYATDFEEFTLGDINGQNGWVGQYADNWTISNANALDGSQHFRGVSDGLGGTRAGNILAISPTVMPATEPFMVLSADINIQGSGVSWEVIPQSPSASSVVTRLLFNGDGTIAVLDANVGDFVAVDATVPSGYFNLRIVNDKDDNVFSIYFDDELIYSGLGFAPLMEQVVFLSDMAVTGSTMDVDNFEITDGDPNAFFLTVSPSTGTVAYGSSADATVKFDARALDPGVYNATINISSNDTNSASLDIPVSLTVLAPPTITVTPDNISEAVNVQTDSPPVKTASFVVSNSGESPLEFSASLGGIDFIPSIVSSNASVADLDLKNYGLGNTAKLKEQLAGPTTNLLKVVKEKVLMANATYSDSIYYDSGVGFPDNFSGLDTSPYTSAVKFEVISNFTLTAIRNAYRTEDVTSPVTILEIYKGGTTPAEGELMATQTVNQPSTEGIFFVEELAAPLSFSSGDIFWVVHKYPSGISFPQGLDSNATQKPSTYYYSSDAGESYSPSGFVFLMRALSGSTEADYITLEPATGTVAPGSSTEVTVTLDGSSLANGIYNRDIIINSNAPVATTTAVSTAFEVSGQISEIAVSDELLSFNNVFIGAEKELSFTISNTGLAQLHITNMSVDHSDFTLSQSEATINAGETLDVTVTFTPTSTTSINGTVTINSDASNTSTVEVYLNGVGQDPPMAELSPTEVSETVDAGETVTSTLTLSNAGNSPLIFSFPDLAVATILADPNYKKTTPKHLSFKGFDSPEKGMKDNRVGSPVLQSVGTDANFGYSWIDSDETGGPVYGFTDISGIGFDATDILGGDGTGELDLSFPVEFYGNTYQSIFVNANGFLSFDLPASFTFINGQIPEDDGINNIIAGLWTDLEPQNFNGAVHLADFGDRFIAQWTNATLYAGAEEETVTFQIVVYADGTIDVYYEDVSSASFINTATVGIENADATDGAQVAFNTTYIKDQLAVRFIKPDLALTSFISNVSPLSGVVPAGGSRSLTVTSDASALLDGVYYDQLMVSSNAPDLSKSMSTFELTVIGTPEIAASIEALDFEPIFVGLESEASFLLENVGTKDLDINSISNSNTDFVLDTTALPLTLAPGESTVVFVTFIPSTVGTITDEITINGTDGMGNESLVIPVSGIGVDPPVISLQPSALDVTLTEGETGEEVVIIENTGNSTLHYSLTTPLFATASEADNIVVKGYDKLAYKKIRSKETQDTRVGPAFLNASGGPGTFGYTWVDNNSGGPAYNFIDISTSGTQAAVGGDGFETVALPFDFNFFGEIQNTVSIAANGFLSFAEITGDNWTNQQIPDPSNPNMVVAPLWDDLEPQNGGGVFYEATAEHFIVQYEAVPGFGFPPFIPVPDPVTFQVILYPNGTITYQYKNVDSTISTSSTVGIEGQQGLSGLQVIFNNTYLTNDLAITFTPPVTGSIEPGQTDEIPVTFSTEDLEGGQTYTGDIKVLSNDPITPEATIPVTLEVLEAPEVVSLSLINAQNNQVIAELTDTSVIDMADYNGINFNIVAQVNDMPIGSVVFDYNEFEGIRKDNQAPYRLMRPVIARLNPFDFPMGENTITATPYANKNGKGKAGIGLTVNFTIVDSSIVPFESFSLVNAATNQVIGTISDGDVIDLADYSSNSFTILANAGATKVRSVIFGLDDDEFFKIDNRAPFALNGDFFGRYYGISLSEGVHNISATGYSSYFGFGSIAAQSSISFEVIDSSTSVMETDMAKDIITIYPNPVTDYTNISVKGKDPILHGTIYNTQGEAIVTKDFLLKNDKGESTIYLGRYPKGIYIIRLTDANGQLISTAKILKK